MAADQFIQLRSDLQLCHYTRHLDMCILPPKIQKQILILFAILAADLCHIRGYQRRRCHTAPIFWSQDSSNSVDLSYVFTIRIWHLAELIENHLPPESPLHESLCFPFLFFPPPAQSIDSSSRWRIMWGPILITFGYLGCLGQVPVFHTRTSACNSADK